MRPRKYFYITTDWPAKEWADQLEHNPARYEHHIGGEFWPYTLKEARHALKRDGTDYIYKFGLPFYNFIEEVK